jgi:hypothetical protein
MILMRIHLADLLDGLDNLKKIPELLNDYSRFSNALLALLSLAGLLILVTHLYRIRSSKEGLPMSLVLTGVFLLFASISGFVLKYEQRISREQEDIAFLSRYRAPDGEYRVQIFDFLPTVDEGFGNKMNNLVAAISEPLIEDLPEGFPQPKVVRVPLIESPWRRGIDPANFEDALSQLNGFEIVWGGLRDEGKTANAWLGLRLPKQLAGTLDTYAPLRDFNFGEDPGRELRFSDGYYRILGLITLGIGLDSYRQAQAATGEERKKKFLETVQRFTRARQLVSNRRQDDILKKTVFSKKVDELIQIGLQEAGVDPQ